MLDSNLKTIYISDMKNLIKPKINTFTNFVNIF